MPKLVKTAGGFFAPLPDGPPKSDPPAQDPVTLLRAASTQFAEHATQLSERIQQFQSWLDKLPGKTAATCWHELEERTYLGLRYVRSGDWELQCAWIEVPPSYYFEGQGQAYCENNADWNSLLRAPVESKIAVIDLFPDLIVAITASARDRVASVVQATRKFDEFAKQFGVTEEGGK